jgi:hypothetical protein
LRVSPIPRDFVDMLDERGILFWSEIPIWGGGFSQAELGDETVVNNKGVMNEYRRPKEAYYAAQRCYKSFKNEQ